MRNEQRNMHFKKRGLGILRKPATRLAKFYKMYSYSSYLTGVSRNTCSYGNNIRSVRCVRHAPFLAMYVPCVNDKT